MTERILIAGHYGRKNAGDEVILQGILAQLRSLRSDLEFTVLTANKDETVNLHNIQAIEWSDLNGTLAAVKNSSLVMVGGGGILNDYWGADGATFFTKRQGGLTEYGAPLILAQAVGRPGLLYGVGVGPIRSEQGKEITRELMELAAIAVVRDDTSRSCLSEIGCDVEAVHVAPDPAFFAPIPRSYDGFGETQFEDLRRPVLAVCLRSWEFNVEGSDWESEVTKGLDAFIDQVGGSVLFIPMQRGEPGSDDDLSISSRVLHRMRNADRARLWRTQADPIQRFWAVTQCDLVLGMRLHSLVAAIRGAVPLVGIAYDAKVTSLLLETGLKRYLVPLDSVLASSIENALLDAYHGKDELRKHLMGVQRSLRDRGATGARIALGLLGKSRTRARHALLLEVLMTQLEARLSAESELLREAQALDRELERRVNLESRFAKAQRDNSQLRLQNGRETERARAAELKLTEITTSRGWKLLSVLWKPVWKMRGWLRKVLQLEKLALASFRRASGALREIMPRWLRHLVFMSKTCSSGPAEGERVVLYASHPELLSHYSPRRSLHGDHDQRLKVSLISTVKDEIGNVPEWLESLDAQRRKPDEVIIVDGGSTDGTWEALVGYEDHGSLNVKVIRSVGDNIARGRNLAVSMSNHEIVAFTDFGCRMNVDWLRNLMIPFEDDSNLQVVAGWYEPVSRSSLGIALGFELVPRLMEVRPQAFLPSARSMAVRKELFETVGGFPEWLTLAGEDTYFDLQLKRRTECWAFVPEAYVEWRSPETLRAFWKKVKRDAKGDGESGAFAGAYMKRLYYLGTGVVVLGVLSVVAAFRASRWMSVVDNRTFVAILVALLTAIVLGHTLRLVSPALGLRLIAQIGGAYGFLRGARRRSSILARRYAGIRGMVFMLTGVPIDDSGGGHRGAQLALEYASRGFLVVFIHRFPKAESVDLSLETQHRNVLHYRLSDFDWVAFSYEYRDLMAQKKLSAIVEFPLPEFVPIVERLAELGGRVIYDAIDDWDTSLGGGWFRDSVEKSIVDHAHVLVATAKPLADKLERTAKRPAHLLPNAVDLRLFDRSVHHARPKDMLDSDRTAVYVGALWGEWFDWGLLLHLANSLPSAMFVVVGDYRGQISRPPTNLQFVGLKSQTEVPAYLANAQAGIIPWRLCAISRATSPLKAYEYLAMGLPVVAPDLDTLPDAPLVFRSANNRDFIRNVETAMGLSRFEMNLDEFLRRNTWSSRVDELEELLEA